MIKRYIWNVLIWIDQGVNCVIFLGDPDETISSRAGKYAANRRGWIPCQLCKFLNLFEKDHCVRSIETDEGSRNLF
jgi:hypothetical protein